MGAHKAWGLETTSRMLSGWVLVGLCLLVPCPPILPCSSSSPRLFRRAFEQRRALRSFSIRSLGHTARCRKFVFAPACRGIQSKRAGSLPSQHRRPRPPSHRLQEIQGEFFPKVWVREEQAGVLAGSPKVNKGDMEDPQKVDRNLGSSRSLEGLVEHNLVKELLEEEGEVIKRPPRAWRPLDPKMERFFSTMMINKRLHEW